MITPYLLSFLAMLSFGVAWFLAALSSKKLGALKAAFLFQLIGIPFFLLLVPFAEFSASLNGLFFVLLLGVYESFVMLLLFYSLQIGYVSIVTPIIDSYGLFALPLGVFFLNEYPSFFKIIAAFIIFIGVILLSIKVTKGGLSYKFKLNKGAIYALITAIGTAVYFIFVGVLARQVGWFINALGIRIAISLTLFIILLLRKTNFKKLFSNAFLKLLIPGAFLDVIGFSLFNMSVLNYQVSYATVITSAQSLVIVLLSWWFLKERLKPYQLLGLLAVIVGLIILGL